VVTALITAEGLVRLDAALAWIEANPERHQQQSWARRREGCGTAFCLAGVVAHLAGAQPVFDPTLADLLDEVTARIDTADGHRRLIEDYAAELLGIGRDEADWLFRAYNDRWNLHEIRDELAESLAAESALEPTP
jgi:hypothetical protein